MLALPRALDTDGILMLALFWAEAATGRAVSWPRPGAAGKWIVAVDGIR
jgi:hypothetical protein